jgi:hypothetical protein
MDLALTKRIYSRDALDEAAKAFFSELRVVVRQEDDSDTLIHMTNLSGGASDDRTIHEFLNKLLELSIIVQICDEEAGSNDGEALPEP